MGPGDALLKHGIVEPEVWRILTEAHAKAYDPKATQNDKQRYVRLARDACRGNYDLFFVLMMEHDPPTHFWERRSQLRGHRLQMVEAFRGGSKTLSFTICETVHDVCYASLAVMPDHDVRDEKYLEEIILGLFETDDRAMERLHSVMEIINLAPDGSLLRAAFGDVKSRASQWSDAGINFPSAKMRTQPNVRFIGAKSAIVGAHATKILADDLVSPENSKSTKLRDSIWNWWTATISKTIKDGTRVRFVFTPYYSDDLHARLKVSRLYKTLAIPCMNQPPRRGEDYNVIENGDGTVRVQMLPLGFARLKSAWPCPLGDMRCPGATSEHIADVGYHRPLRELCQMHYEEPISFMSQMMLRLTAEHDARIRPEMMRFWAPAGHPMVGKVAKWHMHLEESERPVVVAFPTASEVTIGSHCWDHAIGKKAAHDNTSVCFCHRTKGNQFFFQWRRGKMDFDSAVKKMESYYTTDPVRPPRYIGSEAVSFQTAYSQSANKSQLIPAGVVCPMQGNKCEAIGLDGLGSTSSKDALLVDSGLLNVMLQGKAFFPVEDDAGVNEMLGFVPSEEHAHDDDVDSARGAFNLVKARKAQAPLVLRTR
jgi:hypothetical protein